MPGAGNTIDQYEFDFDYDGNTFSADYTENSEGDGKTTQVFNNPGTVDVAVKVWANNGDVQAYDTEMLTLQLQSVTIIKPSTGQHFNEGDVVPFEATITGDPDFDLLPVKGINWGDLTSTIPSISEREEDGSATITDNHVYNDNTIILQGDPFPAPIGVIVGQTTTPLVNIQVDNEPPTIIWVEPANPNSAIPSVIAGEGLKLTANINDPGKNDTLDAEINWGNGQITNINNINPPPTPPPVSGISVTLNGETVFNKAGTYTVKVTATDDDGGVDIDSFSVNVQDKPSPPQEGGNSGGQTVTTPTQTPTTPVVNNQAQKNALNKQIKALNKKIANLNKQIKNHKKKLKKANAKQKKAIKKKIANLNKQIKSSKKKVSNLKKQIKKLK